MNSRKNLGSRKPKKTGTMSAKGDMAMAHGTRINKYLDVTGSSAAITTSGLFNGLGNISAGTGLGNRAGQRIRITRVDYRIQLIASLTSSITTADIYNNIRVVLGRCIGPQSILSTTNFPSTALFVDERQEFEVMLDHTSFVKNVASGLAAAGSAFGGSPEGKWLIGSLPYNHEVLYDTTSGTTDSFNVPFYYAVSDSAATPSPTVNAAFRIWFKDVVA